MKAVFLVILLCALSTVLECNRQKRIVVGNEVKPHSKPYQVHIIFILKTGDVEICGGALISTNYVLTAAHCFRSLQNITQTAVIIGAHRLTDQDKEYQITENYIIHKDYQYFPEGYAINDIALIQLNEPVELTENIQLINLPTRTQINESFNRIIASVSGWGKTETEETSDVLVEGISVIHEDQEICQFPKPLICTLAIEGTPCTGDSGSPLVYNNTVIGVLSAGYCFLFSFYTRITSFLDWIEENSDVNIMT